jgi:hypothetical protein
MPDQPMPRLPDGITQAGDDFIVDADLVAGSLGLTAEQFLRESRHGIVYSVVERGEGEDRGRTRLTLRYRARSWSVTLEDAHHDRADRSRPAR